MPRFSDPVLKSVRHWLHKSTSVCHWLRQCGNGCYWLRQCLCHDDHYDECADSIGDTQYPLASKLQSPLSAPSTLSPTGMRRVAARHRDRAGAVLIAALVCLLIVMTILGAMLEGTLRARRQLHTERDRRQTELLLAAGIDRAAYRLANDADYEGETWSLSAADISGRAAAQVIIKPSRDSADSPWQVHVVAEYPLGNEHSIRRSRTSLIQPQPTDNQE